MLVPWRVHRYTSHLHLFLNMSRLEAEMWHDRGEMWEFGGQQGTGEI